MTTIPDLRVAICKRCRWPNRIARGAATDETLRACGKAMVSAGAIDAHVRLSQCLNCCDGGHTVRLEHQGWEFAFIGIRTEDELKELLEAAPTIVQFPVGIAEKAEHTADTDTELSPHLAKRIYQIWHDNKLVWPN